MLLWLVPELAWVELLYITRDLYVYYDYRNQVKSKVFLTLTFTLHERILCRIKNTASEA